MRTFIVALVLGVAPAGRAQDAADVILVNGRIYTLEPSRPWAEALAVKGDRILAVGTNEEIRRFKETSTREVDLAGAFASPGFNDSHVHVDGTGALLTGVNLLDVHEAQAFRERIERTTERLPQGSWITRGMWGAYEQWQAGSSGEAPSSGKSSGPFTPDRGLIDAVSPDHPVLVSRFDRSMHLANSLALKLAGIDESTPAPEGGELQKDASGRLTGILKGNAVDLVEEIIPPISFEQHLVQVRAVLKEAREGGVTTIQDLTSAEQLMAYQQLKKTGELTARIMIRPNIFQAGHVAALGLTRGFGNDWLKLIGYKGAGSTASWARAGRCSSPTTTTIRETAASSARRCSRKASRERRSSSAPRITTRTTRRETWRSSSESGFPRESRPTSMPSAISETASSWISTSGC